MSPSKMPEMAEVNSKTIQYPPPIATLSDDAPPPYVADISSTNPGFCTLAFLERRNNRLPGGGMPSSQYFLPCKDCSSVCNDKIPLVYRSNWPDWIDPSVNFRWESHTGTAVINGEKKELLGCWICWEMERKWCKPMLVDEWYQHIRTHLRKDGYVVCKGKQGAMQRRRNCEVIACPKIHS